MKKYLTKILLVCCLSIGVLLSGVSYAAATDEYSKNEEYYYNLCSKIGLTNAEKTVCSGFQAYLQEKAIKANKDVTRLNNSIAAIKKDLNGFMLKVADYNAQIAAIQKDINNLNTSIATITENIEVLETRIVIRENNIERLDGYIKERMVMMQGVNNYDGYIDFIFGAKDFGDFIRRAEGIKDITTYDRDQISQLQEEIKALNSDRDDLMSQRSILEAQKTTLETNIRSIKILKAEVDKIIVEYRKVEAQLEAEQAEAVDNLKEIRDALNKVTTAIGNVQPSPGWIYPIKGKFSISAGCWNYPASFGGGRHVAVDFAAAGGRSVVAPGNGVILFVSDQCPSIGYYCQRCGSSAARSGGNQVVLMIQVKSSVYMIINYHFRSGVSNVVKVGQIVSQGDVIGYVGSSGCSTGNHLHQHIVYLGENNMAAMVEQFKKKGDITMGAGFGDTAYNNRCSARNWKPPCTESPLEIYNIKVGKSYTGK